MNRRETTIPELVQLTEKFVALADRLLEQGKITEEEYDDLTYLKKNFLKAINSNSTYAQV